MANGGGPPPPVQTTIASVSVSVPPPDGLRFDSPYIITVDAAPFGATVPTNCIALFAFTITCKGNDVLNTSNVTDVKKIISKRTYKGVRQVDTGKLIGDKDKLWVGSSWIFDKKWYVPDAGPLPVGVWDSYTQSIFVYTPDACGNVVKWPLGSVTVKAEPFVSMGSLKYKITVSK